MLKAFPGNTLVEYVLPGTLALGLCIVGFNMIGSGLNAILQALKEDMATSIQAADRHQAAALAVSNTPTAADGPSSEASTSTSTVIAKQAIDISQTSRAIMTVGANGATELLMGQLVVQIQQWQKEGKLTQTQANLLVRLANDGYQMAAIQKQLEEGIEQRQSIISANDAQGYGASMLTPNFGYSPNRTAEDVRTLNPEVAGSFMKPFADAYQLALTNGAMSDPVIHQKITDLAVQISVLADTLGGLNTKLGGSIPDINKFHQILATGFERAMEEIPMQTPVPADTRNLTSHNSGRICTIGSGSVNGAGCSAP